MARAYHAPRRAAAAEATRTALLRAGRVVFQDEERYDLPLHLVAERAGVALRTLHRHFATKEDLLEAVLQQAATDIAAERPADPGDLDGALAALAAHYEGVGPANRRMALWEARSPAVARVLEHARGFHAEWARVLFSPHLRGSPAARAEQLALLTTVTDLDVWTLLRGRQGLPPDAALAALRRLVAGVLEDPS